MTKKLKLTFCGGTGIVTGANFLLETVAPEKPFRILVDCGLVQGEMTFEHGVRSDANRIAFPYDPSSIDVLLITHSHIDHVGRIGKLIKDGFRGTIYSTPETRRLSEVMMEDCVHVLGMSSQREGVLPLYDEEDVAAAFPLWRTIPYHENFDLTNGFSAYLRDAGHVLGSTIYELTYNGKKIAFTGDLGNTPSPLLKDTEPVTDAQYMVMESVYGDRNHEPKDERDRKFADIVRASIGRHGVLIIPAFSLERTQVVIYQLEKLMATNAIPKVPVYVDSPLAIKVTKIYRDLAEKDFNEKAKKMLVAGQKMLEFGTLHFVETAEESKSLLDRPNPKIIMAGSGMSNGGRIVHHEKNYLPDPNNTILLIGYEAAGTMGRQIQDGAKSVRIMGEEVAVRAHVEMVSGYSSHKDSDHLVQFVEKGKESLKQVFVAMGEPKSALFLVQRFRDYLGVNAVAPSLGQSFDLDF